MLSEEEIKKQINQVLSEEDLSDKERLAFILMAVDLVRKKVAQEIQQTLSEKDFDEIEKMEGNDEILFAEMVKRWEKKTGKTSEMRVKELVLELFAKFLETKEKIAPTAD